MALDNHTFGIIVISIIVIILGALCIMLWNYWNSKKHFDENDFLTKDLKSFSNEKLDDFDPLDDSFGKSKDVMQGINSKFRWTQTSDEAELFVFVENSVKSRNVQVDILCTGLVLSVGDNTIISDDFYDEVIPADSFWQLGKFTLLLHVKSLILASTTHR